jgi:LPS-assembly protein
VAEGHDGKVVFKGVPIFYSPWLSFSLNNQRKSGFLQPSYGTSSDSGFELALPYYWNIAPNMDATISPRIMSKRGVQLRNEFRYLDTAFGGFYRGQAQAEILPDDRQKDGERRYGLSLQHTQTTAKGFTGQINYNKVSDDNYYTDLSSGISSTSQTQLLQQGLVSYGGGGWWTATANFQQYQTLQPDKENPVLEQYRMLPQLTFNARRPDFYSMDASLLGQYTLFTKARQVINGAQIDDPDGKRSVLYPQIALPYIKPGWYVTPKLGVNVRHYALSGQSATIPDSISVTLPIFSVDSGMTFERSSNWFGRDYTQTLEPRLFYLNVPYKNQDKIPIFDTALADFNFAQIFSENQFNGWDRVSNANQVTTGLTTRLIEPSSGSEIMRAMVGQRFYFSQNKVGLTPQNTVSDDENKWDSSDFLASFSGQILPRVYADTAVQYNWGDREVKRYSLGVRYQPEPGKVLNAAYRYNTDPNAPVDQIDVSGQWPISGPLYGVGRINYSLRDTGAELSTGSTGGRIIESLAGLEYNGGCWVLRGVVRRQALTEDKTSTAFFIQLELSDFARVGSNPLSLLKRSVQGYGLINQPVADPVFGE